MKCSESCLRVRMMQTISMDRESRKNRSFRAVLRSRGMLYVTTLKIVRIYYHFMPIFF
jgi:hypothetical protein